jgi:hypothetical protein
MAAQAFADGSYNIGRYWISRVMDESREAGLYKCLSIVGFQGAP